MATTVGRFSAFSVFTASSRIGTSCGRMFDLLKSKFTPRRTMRFFTGGGGAGAAALTGAGGGGGGAAFSRKAIFTPMPAVTKSTGPSSGDERQGVLLIPFG